MTRHNVKCYAIFERNFILSLRIQQGFPTFRMKTVYFRILENYLQFSKVFLTPFLRQYYT